jgi:hypothetical protein
MKYLLRILTSIMLLFTVSICLSPNSAQSQQAVDITLAPDQPSVEAGKTIRFWGDGFYQYEDVDSWATDPTGAVSRGEYTKADGEGKVKLTFHVPNEAIDGEWKFTAYGDESQLPVWVSFDVYGRSASTAQYMARVSPPEGTAGMVFTFSANDFKRGERISYWITDPNGQVFFANPRGEKANRHGRVEFAWESPQSMLPGRWVMTMQGYDSKRARAIPFIITGKAGETGETGETTESNPTPQPTSQEVTTPTPWYTPLPTYEPVPYATTTPQPSQSPLPTPSPTYEGETPLIGK